ncbi:LysR family transcriptional regulator [Enterocloster asparagiformis]|uniref:LysR family transcriptional regulator n=1 Tax=Enterocloster asparagiformis TaxID=333367 RepID=UPI002A8256B8|nr:LysR family transcriptional regulator [Enterocloster asparagiformis]
MYLKEFRYLLTIAAEGNITKAADRLYISQPSLSHFLTEYEKDMGFDIFTRFHFGVKPTAQGEQLLQIAKRTMEEIEALVPKHTPALIQDCLKVNIGIPDQRAMMLTPYFLSHAKRELPQIKFHIIEDTPKKLMEMLNEDCCDLFIAASTTKDSFYPELKCSFLCSEEIKIAVPPGHDLEHRVRRNPANEPYVAISDLKGLDYCLCTNDRNIRLFSDEFLKNHNIPHNIISTSSNIATALNSCLAFNALTFVPKKFAYINSGLAYFSIGRKRVYWHLQILSKQDLQTAVYYEGITKIFRNYYL